MSIVEKPLDDEHCLIETHLPFDVLYQRYALRVYRYLRGHLENDDDIADIEQQVFFQVWMNLHTYQPERGTFATWIMSIAHHRLVDFYRSARPSVPLEARYELALMEQNPEEIVISAESLARVKDLLDALPRSERELLVLRFAARLSIVEIAQLIGKSAEATKKQLSRLLQRLQEHYRRQALEERVPESAQRTLPTFAAVLLQVYAVSPPRLRLTFLRQTHCI